MLENLATKGMIISFMSCLRKVDVWRIEVGVEELKEVMRDH